MHYIPWYEQFDHHVRPVSEVCDECEIPGGVQVGPLPSEWEEQSEGFPVQREPGGARARAVVRLNIIVEFAELSCLTLSRPGRCSARVSAVITLSRLPLLRSSALASRMLTDMPLRQ